MTADELEAAIREAYEAAEEDLKRLDDELNRAENSSHALGVTVRIAATQAVHTALGRIIGEEALPLPRRERPGR